MKNKYGLIGFLSILGIWGLYQNEPIFLSFLAFIVFFEYFFIEPDELFIVNMRKAGTWGFFTNIAITSLATLVMSAFNISSNALAGGATLGFSIGIAVFCFSTSFLEWKEKREIKNDI